MRQELTLSSGESSAEVDTESEDMAEGVLAGAERSDREVEALARQCDKQKEEIVCESCVLDHRHVSNSPGARKNTQSQQYQITQE